MRVPFFRRRRREQELDEEIRAHLEMAVQDRVRRGESRADAERAVRREFGNEARVREVTRAMWGGVWWDRLVQDVRYGVRSLVANRGFTAVAVLTLGLGIGLATAMFTVVNGVLLRPLPFVQPDRLVLAGLQPPDRPDDQPLVHQDEEFPVIRDRTGVFAAAGTYMIYPPTTLTGSGEPARLTAAWVTGGFLDVLGVPPVTGRGLTPEDDRPGSGAVVVLSDALWRSRFAADPDVLGRTVTLDGIGRTVVGVMPPGFDFPSRADLWLPMEAHPFRDEGLTFRNPVVARLAEGVGAGQAASDLSALAVSGEWRLGPGDEVPVGRVVPLKDAVVGDSRDPLLVFTGAVALVLLLACTNVANLLLMRAGARRHEVGLRTVLGAGRLRLVRQLLTESVMVALLGGVAGVGVAALGVRALLALAPAGTIPRDQTLGVDPAALGFTLLASVAVGLLFGLAPALRATEAEVHGALAQATRTHTPRRGLARSALVVVEIGLAVVLLTSAGLLMRSFQEIRAIDLGFQPEGALTFFVDLPEDAYPDPSSALTLHQRILEGLARIPGVETAGAANFESFGPLSVSTRVAAEDAPEERTGTEWMLASPGYVRAMGVRLLAGRGFTEEDDGGSPPVVVVSRALAERLWPGRDPLGQRLSSGGGEWRTVVGVTEDLVRGDVIAERGPLMVLPLAQVDDVRNLRHMSYVVRTASRAPLASAIRAVVRDADPKVPVGAVTTMDQVVLDSLGDRRFQTRVLGAFAVLALILATVGVYGVIAYSVSERTRELGIRMALGARREQVALLTLAQVGAPVAVGLAVGLSAAMAAGRFLEASLYGVEPNDPATLVGVAVALGAAAAVATIAPTRRATRIDPVEVLG